MFYLLSFVLCLFSPLTRAIVGAHNPSGWTPLVPSWTIRHDGIHTHNDNDWMIQAVLRKMFWGVKENEWLLEKLGDKSWLEGSLFCNHTPLAFLQLTLILQPHTFIYPSTTFTHHFHWFCFVSYYLYVFCVLGTFSDLLLKYDYSHESTFIYNNIIFSQNIVILLSKSPAT